MYSLRCIVTNQVKEERNFQQITLKNTSGSKHFGANFVQIGQGIIEIFIFEIFEQSQGLSMKNPLFQASPILNS